MTNQFASILSEHGFDTESDLYDSITAFDYDVCGVMFDDDSPFSAELSETKRQPENPDCLLSCSLRVKPQWSIDEASKVLTDIWNRWLALPNPKVEIIERHLETDSAVVRVLTVSQSADRACSIEFKLTKGVSNV